MAIYEVQKGFNRQSLAYLDEMYILSVLTDAIIAPLTTVAGLRAVSFASYETSRRFYEQWQAHVDRAEAIGIYTDATIAAADTVAGLVALHTAEDATISQTGNKSLVAA